MHLFIVLDGVAKRYTRIWIHAEKKLPAYS